MYNKSSFSPTLVRLFHCIMLGYALLRIKNEIPLVGKAISSLNTCGMSEFLINYQGGFVRRGLIGELLYFLTTTTGIDCRLVIIPFCCTTFLLLTLFLLYAFQRNNICWWILPLNFVLFGLDFIRKDTCMMLIVAMVLSAYARVRNVPGKLFLVNCFLLLGLNVHECTFFIIGFFMTALILFDPQLRLSLFKRCVAILPFGCMMAALSFFHGNERIALDVFNSLAKIYPHDFGNFASTGTIASLSWPTSYAIKFHYQMNFVASDGFVCGFWLKPVLWVVTFFLTARLPFILQQAENQQTRTDLHAYLSAMIFQWAAMFPLFTVLHADTGRALAYWSVSSLLIYIILPTECIEASIPGWYKRLVAAWQRLIYTPKVRYAVPVLMCITATPFFGIQWRHIFSHSVVGTYHYFIRDIIEWVSGCL